jgi:CheY-like chemotaxis protein
MDEKGVCHFSSSMTMTLIATCRPITCSKKVTPVLKRPAGSGSPDSKKFDLVMLDIEIPVLDGIETLQLLKQDPRVRISR